MRIAGLVTGLLLVVGCGGTSGASDDDNNIAGAPSDFTEARPFTPELRAGSYGFLGFVVRDGNVSGYYDDKTCTFTFSGKVSTGRSTKIHVVNGIRRVEGELIALDVRLFENNMTPTVGLLLHEIPNGCDFLDHHADGDGADGAHFERAGEGPSDVVGYRTVAVDRLCFQTQPGAGCPQRGANALKRDVLEVVEDQEDWLRVRKQGAAPKEPQGFVSTSDLVALTAD